jgi:hypothetical protein
MKKFSEKLIVGERSEWEMLGSFDDEHNDCESSAGLDLEGQHDFDLVLMEEN